MADNPCPWCGDTGRVHVALGPPERCRACAPAWSDLAIDAAAEWVGAIAALAVMGGLWGPAVRALERADGATRGLLDGAIDWLSGRRAR